MSVTKIVGGLQETDTIILVAGDTARSLGGDGCSGPLLSIIRSLTEYI